MSIYPLELFFVRQSNRRRTRCNLLNGLGHVEFSFFARLIRPFRLSPLQSSENIENLFSLTALNAPWRREEKKKQLQFSFRVNRGDSWPSCTKMAATSRFDPVTHFLSHLSAGPRGEECSPEDLGDCVRACVRMHLYVDLMFTQWVPACL